VTGTHGLFCWSAYVALMMAQSGSNPLFAQRALQSYTHSRRTTSRIQIFSRVCSPFYAHNYKLSSRRGASYTVVNNTHAARHSAFKILQRLKCACPLCAALPLNNQYIMPQECQFLQSFLSSLCGLMHLLIRDVDRSARVPFERSLFDVLAFVLVKAGPIVSEVFLDMLGRG
jgi:hypothetical protein